MVVEICAVVTPVLEGCGSMNSGQLCPLGSVWVKMVGGPPLLPFPMMEVQLRILRVSFLVLSCSGTVNGVQM